MNISKAKSFKQIKHVTNSLKVWMSCDADDTCTRQ